MLVSALVAIFSTPIASVIFVIGASIALPPLLKLVEKTGLKLPTAVKYILVIGCFFVGGGLLNNKLNAFDKEQVAIREAEEADAWAKLTKGQQDSVLHAKALEDSLVAIAAAESERKEKINSAFSAIDGSHRKLERYIKENMNDPDSYDHIETIRWDKGTHLDVQTKFRGANAFGGIVIQTVQARVDLDGNVLEIVK
jgi:hypothetical protein